MFLLTLEREEGREGGRRERDEVCVCVCVRERERERSIDWLPPISTSNGDQTYNLSMCPDWELNLQPFGVRDDALTN